jgi:hypothetical protein
MISMFETISLSTDKPESTAITVFPNRNAFCSGKLIQINCTSDAKPPAEYSLYRNNKLVQSRSTSGYFLVVLNNEGNITYMCLPSNAVGIGQSKSLHLIVKSDYDIL